MIDQGSESGILLLEYGVTKTMRSSVLVIYAKPVIDWQYEGRKPAALSTVACHVVYKSLISVKMALEQRKVWNAINSDNCASHSNINISGKGQVVEVYVSENIVFYEPTQVGADTIMLSVN